MLWERKDVNPNRTDTEYGRTPLTWATLRGRDGIVKMLLERKNAYPAMPDNVNQTPESLAPSEGHDEVARIPLERDEANCAAADLNSPTPLPPTAMHPDDSSVEIQFISDNPNTDITDSSGQPGLISVVHSEQPRLLDHHDSTPMSAVSGLSTQSPWWYRPQPTLLFAFDRRFIISSLIILLALLLYFLPSSLLQILISHQYLPSVGG